MLSYYLSQIPNNPSNISLLFQDKLLDKTIQNSRKDLLDIINTQTKTFDNQFKALDETFSRFKLSMTILDILKNLSLSEQIKNSAFNDLMCLENNFKNIFLENDKLYQSLTECISQIDIFKLNPEEQHTIDETLFELRKHGLHLPINERTSIALDNREKDFLNNRFFSNLPDYETFYNKIVYCEDENMRKILWKDFHNNNYEILNEDFSQILKLKNSVAKTIGLKNCTELDLAFTPLKTTQEIDFFLEKTILKFKDNIIQEIEALKKLNNHKTINPWDLDYLLNKYEQEKLQPLSFDNFLTNICNFWQKKLNIKIIQENNAIYKLWSEDILIFSIFKNNILIGTILIDKSPIEKLTIIVPALNNHPGLFLITASSNFQAKNIFLNFGQAILLTTNPELELPGNGLSKMLKSKWEITNYELEILFYEQFASRKKSLTKLLLQKICNSYICLNTDKLSRKNNAIKVYNKSVKEVYIKFNIDKILNLDTNLEFNYNLSLAITKGAGCYTSTWALINLANNVGSIETFCNY